MTTKIDDAKHSEHDPFPFMKLPPELRSLVYTFALQGFIDEVEASYPETPAWELPEHGLPALLNVTSLRYESSNAMLLPARAHYERHKRLRDEFEKNDEGRSGSPLKYETVSRRAFTVGLMSSEIDDVHSMEKFRSTIDTIIFDFQQKQEASLQRLFRRFETKLFDDRQGSSAESNQE